MTRRTGLSTTIALSLVTMVALLAGCTTATAPSTGTAPTTSGQSHLSYLQGIGTLGVDFFGLVTFRSGASMTTFPSTFFVHTVPITWSGTSFIGFLGEKGAGEDITDTVEGKVSPDGNTLTSLTYSRTMLRTAAGNGTSYKVTLQNVPLAAGATVGTFQLSGADVQKYVSAIQYADGQLSGGQITSSFEYVTTEWTNANPAQTPSLIVTFGG